MRVDKDIVAQVVEQIISQLSEAHGTENLVVVGERNPECEIVLPFNDGKKRKLYYSREGYGAARVDRYILPRLELNDMVDLAQGKASSPEAEEVRSLVLTGKTVEVLEYAYTSCENSAPPQLFRLYSDYAKTLDGFGIRPVKPVHKATRIEKRVISEQDMEKLQVACVKCVHVSRNALVTSLAEDCARKFGIEIQRDGRGA